jgi:hypothetical protein
VWGLRWSSASARFGGAGAGVGAGVTERDCRRHDADARFGEQGRRRAEARQNQDAYNRVLRSSRDLFKNVKF